MYELQKAVGIVGTNGFVPHASFLSTNELLGKVGQNTGNLFFQYAVFNLIKDKKLLVGTDTTWDPGEIRTRCRILVVPSANFLRENFDFTEFVRFLESCKLPILFLGLGAQAADYSRTSFDFHPSIIRLIDLIKDQGVGVGVRGEFSGDVLSQYGVSNIQVIGCPTNFVNPDEGFVEKLKDKWNSNSETILVAGDEPWPKSVSKQRAERKLVDIAVEMSGLYVQQSVEPFVRALRRANCYQGADVDQRLMDSLRLALAPSMSSLEFKRFLVASVRFYIDVNQWLEDASRFDISIGLRLHGNMIAFQAGCPSVWIHHDSRTRELVETMGLPSLTLEQFLDCQNIDQIKNRVCADFDSYSIKRMELRSRFDHLLAKNSIS